MPRRRMPRLRMPRRRTLRALCCRELSRRKLCRRLQREADEKVGRGWQCCLSSLVTAATTGENTGRGDDTPSGWGARLLLDYNAVEGMSAVLPHFTMRRRIYSVADEDLVAVWCPLAVVQLLANILVDDAFWPQRWGLWQWDSWQRCCSRLRWVWLFLV